MLKICRVEAPLKKIEGMSMEIKINSRDDQLMLKKTKIVK